MTNKKFNTIRPGDIIIFSQKARRVYPFFLVSHIIENNKIYKNRLVAGSYMSFGNIFTSNTSLLSNSLYIKDIFDPKFVVL